MVCPDPALAGPDPAVLRAAAGDTVVGGATRHGGAQPPPAGKRAAGGRDYGPRGSHKQI